MRFALGLCAALTACGKPPPPTTPDKIRRFDRGTSMAVVTERACPADLATALRAEKSGDGIDVYVLRLKGTKNRCKFVKTSRQGAGPHQELRQFVEEDRHATP